MLRRATGLRKHFMTHGSNHPHWERVPSVTYNGAVSAPAWPERSFDPHTEKIRGSGIWGPEVTSVMRLVLWNRLKQRRPQRVVPTLKEAQAHFELETAIMWWCFGVVFL